MILPFLYYLLLTLLLIINYQNYLIILSSVMSFMFWPVVDEVEFPVKGYIGIRVVCVTGLVFSLGFKTKILLGSSTSCRRLLSLGVYLEKLC